MRWKLVDIDQDIKLSVVLMGKPVSHGLLGFSCDMRTIDEIPSLLKNLENLHLCDGGPTANKYPDAETGMHICQRLWTVGAQKCAQVLPANGACKRCAGLSDTLCVHHRGLLRKEEKGARTNFGIYNFRNYNKVRVFQRAQYALK